MGFAFFWAALLKGFDMTLPLSINVPPKIDSKKEKKSLFEKQGDVSLEAQPQNSFLFRLLDVIRSDSEVLKQNPLLDTKNSKEIKATDAPQEIKQDVRSRLKNGISSAKSKIESFVKPKDEIDSKDKKIEPKKLGDIIALAKSEGVKLSKIELKSEPQKDQKSLDLAITKADVEVQKEAKTEKSSPVAQEPKSKKSKIATENQPPLQTKEPLQKEEQTATKQISAPKIETNQTLKELLKEKQATKDSEPKSAPLSNHHATKTEPKELPEFQKEQKPQETKEVAAEPTPQNTKEPKKRVQKATEIVTKDENKPQNEVAKPITCEIKEDKKHTSLQEPKSEVKAELNSVPKLEPSAKDDAPKNRAISQKEPEKQSIKKPEKKPKESNNIEVDTKSKDAPQELAPKKTIAKSNKEESKKDELKLQDLMPKSETKRAPTDESPKIEQKYLQPQKEETIEREVKKSNETLPKKKEAQEPKTIKTDESPKESSKEETKESPKSKSTRPTIEPTEEPKNKTPQKQENESKQTQTINSLLLEEQPKDNTQTRVTTIAEMIKGRGVMQPQEQKNTKDKERSPEDSIITQIKESKNQNTKKNVADEMPLQGLLSEKVSNMEMLYKSAAAKDTIKNFASDLKEQVENYKPPVTKLSMELHPENLGKVDVTITTRGNNLIVQLTSNQVAINIFAQNQVEFKTSLANLGFNDVSMQFSFGGGESEAGDREQNGRQRNNNRLYSSEELSVIEALDSLEIAIPRYI